MSKELQPTNFTEGKILGPLIRFALPVLGALFLQATYGAVDLLIVGQFVSSVDVSAVATGSGIMLTLTQIVISFSMGTTIILARQIGEGRHNKAGETIGGSMTLFGIMGLVITGLTIFGAEGLASLMHAPAEAFNDTSAYIRICGAGTIVIVAYNLIGSIFRGLGDSFTPLISVISACVSNILGDLLFVAIFGMGAKGAALATVLAQALSVILSLVIIRIKKPPFTIRREDIRINRDVYRKVTKLGLPIALQDLLVGLSFLIIQAIVNSLGLMPSAGVGVAEKVCAFIMLVPSSFMQSMSSFVAQNAGANKYDRAIRALRYGILLSFIAGVTMFYVTFFHGDLLASIFSKDREVVLLGFDYLKSYAIDCLLTAFLFCLLGFFNGLGKTRFVMAQGIIGAFGVRVPVSFMMSRIIPVSLFKIGLATPCSTVVQIAMCLIFMMYLKKKGEL
jgi:putative MATE family efflux protein